MKLRSLIPQVYGALFEIPMLREEVHALGREGVKLDSARFLSRLSELEQEALRLVEQVEQRQRVSAH